MELAGKVIAVTGAATGIGAAIAERLAAAGVAGTVVADRDVAGAAKVAASLPRTVAVGCDVATAEGVETVVAAAERAFGPVDVFCANAGVGVGRDERSPYAEWDLAMGVNVWAHVLAARRLVPEWLERGSGWFISVASAAGLLTQIGSAPYAVSKHAAVAFAEWLAVTYGDRGIGVSCVCPMAVDTSLLRNGEHAGGMPRTATSAAMRAGAVIEPADVAEHVLRGLVDERFLILPHPEVLEFFQRKAADYDRWLGGMRRLRDSSVTSA